MPRRPRGQSVIEYAVLIGALVLIIVTAAFFLSGAVNSLIGEKINAVSAGAPGGGSGGGGDEEGGSTDPAAFSISNPTTPQAGDTVAFIGPADASPYSWDFGDGETSTDQNPSHVYDTPGNYSVTLVSAAGTYTDDVQIATPAPANTFTVSSDPAPGTPVTFTGPSENATSWSWDFGDSDTGSGQVATHTYDDAGTYTVTMTVTGPGGSVVGSQDVEVAAGAPVASFTSSETEIAQGDFVTFTSTSTGDITSYSWDFDDFGASATGPTASYQFFGTGDYDVTLTVTGPGGTDTATVMISVMSPPQAQIHQGPWGNEDTTYVTAGELVSFNSSGTTGATSYAWDFNEDGIVDATGASASYTFSEGTYMVTLTVSGPGGSDLAWMTVVVMADDGGGGIG